MFRFLLTPVTVDIILYQMTVTCFIVFVNVRLHADM